MNAPAITVLLPAYNAAPFVGVAIDSILAQTCGDFEVLAIDDGSVDGTREILRSYRDPRLRVLVNESNRGLSATLNRGLVEARGEFIARQDADDRSDAQRFSRQLQAFRERPMLMLLGTAGHQIDAAGRSLGPLEVPRSPLAIRWAMPFLNPFLHTAVMFRRERVVTEFGGYDESFAICQDYELWSRIVARHPTANLSERLLTLRTHPGSLMGAGRERLDAETRRVQAAIFARDFPSLSIAPRDFELLERFRWRLSAQDLEEFWHLFARLRTAFFAAHGEARDDSGVRVTIAAQIGRVAYNLLPEHPFPAARTLWQAVKASPATAHRLPWARLIALMVFGDLARKIYAKMASAE